MSSDDRTAFYTDVRNYFCAAVDYVLKKFPLQDSLLAHAEVADVCKRVDQDFKSVQFFADRYPCLLKAPIETVEQEFLRYQVDTLPDGIINAPRVDTQWVLIGNLKEPGCSDFKYANLMYVARY
jgi:hypothetical protein